MKHVQEAHLTTLSLLRILSTKDMMINECGVVGQMTYGMES
jgi:hypothetical protein